MKNGVSRREFLKTVVITAGAVQAAALIGCSDDSAPDARQTFPDGPPGADAGSPDAAGPSVTFPQSVASGNPHPDSIVLWTRAVSSTAGDVNLTVEVATDAAFTQMVTLSTSALSAKAASDNCVRAKIVGLTAATRYYYRFKSGTATSKTGRFKTAAAAGSDVAVRFAFLSCQDYVGRFYNTLVELLAAAQDDLDFVVHLGDYVYETTGDPGFQQTSGRKVTFSDQAGAIQLGSGQSTFFAARSVSNYRELYKTYRSDPILQQVHEKFPFVVTWDDHEYSDDCWQNIATYFDGLKDEKDTTRRVNAEQAYFEYMPVALDVETGTGALALTRDQLFPNTKLYRDFRFGKNLHLILTDYRSFRPDHPIPEDAFPGKLLMDEATVRATLAAGGITGQNADGVVAKLPPYIDIDAGDFAAQKTAAVAILTAGYTAAGLDGTAAAARATAAAAGKVDLNFLNALWPDDMKAALTVDATGKSHGISYSALGKQGLFAQLGARYLVVKPTYDLWTGFVHSQNPTGDDPYGATQSAWLDGKLAANPDATWKILGSSTSMTSLIVDLSPFASVLPKSIPPTQLYLDCDQWDGFPIDRQALFAKLYAKNVVVISGDIHASYFTDYGPDGDGNRIVEFTGPGVSSQAFKGELRAQAQGIPGLGGSPLVDQLLGALDGLLASANPRIKLASSNSNGIVIVKVDGTQLAGTYSMLDTAEVLTDQTASSDLAGKIMHKTFTVPKTAGKNGAPVGS